ncbi:YceI family protein [Amylibacter sp. SFDW26]|uniref:YceI family protein n=1 Tax=Amylibacter sp. SFDW26 TaxID=2652722 RepID=UPI001261E991|nr:YceI family protein [Amylibacter sp. SFDW26]KAB7615341.1 YceI family protein [Amylibacter sp. SFDW26]
MTSNKYLRLVPLRLGLSVFLAWAIFLGFTHKAIADEWHVDKSRSKLGFTISTPSAPIDGFFEDFDASITFDPDDLAQSMIDIIIHTSTLRLENTQHQSMALSKEWLDTLGFPTAHFKSTSIGKTDNGAFIATGFVTIKKMRHPIEIQFSVVFQDAYAHAKGTANLLRSNFGIGSAENTNIPVADAFVVNFGIHANKG